MLLFLYSAANPQDLPSLPTRALPISLAASKDHGGCPDAPGKKDTTAAGQSRRQRSEEHTAELQSPYDLVCRLLRKKKKVTAVGECFKSKRRSITDYNADLRHPSINLQ